MRISGWSSDVCSSDLSLLFLPASNARAIEKARDLPVDLVVLDLEDAVKAEDKESARRMAAEAAAQGFGDKPSAIRLNAVGSPYFGDDVVAVRRGGAAYIVRPTVESRRQASAEDKQTKRPTLARKKKDRECP